MGSSSTGVDARIASETGRDDALLWAMDNFGDWIKE